VASIYFGFIASDQYAAGFRFTVSNTSAVPSSSPGFLSLLGGMPSGPSSNDDFMVTDYITSRQAVDELQNRIKVKDLYAKPNIDWWSRFDASQPTERFLKYWQSMVTARFDMITGIATAEVRAFTPEDARLIAATLVTLSEELINRIANRSATEAVRAATREVERAQNRLKEVRARLTAYRNKFGIIDPTTSVAASNSSLVQALRANLAQLETQLATLKSQNLLPTAPAIVTLNSQIQSAREQLASTEAQVGRGEAGSGLSTIVAEYELINLDLQYAQTMVTNTMQALDQARANAAVQQLYITPYVRPSLPQSPTYPSRFLSVLAVGLVSFAIWVLSLMLVRAARERFG
jgi:capsular polysaccharide transport system permease protein